MSHLLVTITKPPMAKARRLHAFRCGSCRRVFNRFDKLKLHRKRHKLKYVQFQGKVRYSEFVSISKSAKPYNKLQVVHCFYCQRCFTTISNLEGHISRTHLNTTKNSCPLQVQDKQTDQQIREPVGSDSEEIFERVGSQIKKLIGSPRKRWNQSGKKAGPRSKGTDKSGTRSERTNKSGEVVDSDMKGLIGDQHEEIHKNAGSMPGIMPCKIVITKLSSDHDIRYTELAEKPFQCGYCYKHFKKSHQVRQHIRTHTNERPYQCKYCTKCFKQAPTLKYHVMATHTDQAKWKYKCKYCKRNFPRKHDCAKHMLSHTKEKRFPCQQCELSFKENWNLRQHIMRVHDRLKPYKCEFCQKCFSSNLARHLKTHTKEKPHQCEYCQKRFPVKHALTEHLRIHTKEKPFTCHHCGKCFSLKTTLRNHVTIHTKEKRHQCHLCGKRFATRPSYGRHLKTHTTDRPYHCQYCDMGFIEKNRLEIHERVHTGERPFSCEKCGECFATIYLFKKHTSSGCMKVEDSNMLRKDDSYEYLKYQRFNSFESKQEDSMEFKQHTSPKCKKEKDSKKSKKHKQDKESKKAKKHKQEKGSKKANKDKCKKDSKKAKKHKCKKEKDSGISECKKEEELTMNQISETNSTPCEFGVSGNGALLVDQHSIYKL